MRGSPGPATSPACRLVDTGTPTNPAPAPAPGYHNVAWLLKCPVSAGFLAIKSTTALISDLKPSLVIFPDPRVMLI